MAAAATSNNGTTSAKQFSSPFQSQQNSPHSSSPVIELDSLNISTSRSNKENIQHNHQQQPTTTPQHQFQQQHQQQSQPQQAKGLPVLKPDLFFNDTGLFTVYCFIKNFIG